MADVRSKKQLRARLRLFINHKGERDEYKT